MTSGGNGMADSMTELKCRGCGCAFERRTASVRLSMSRGQESFYCSGKCHAGTRKSPDRAKGTCAGCGADFERRSSGNSDKLMFCSRRCSALASSAGRRRSDLVCSCGNQKRRESKSCRRCRLLAPGKRTIGELRDRHGTWKFHSVVRQHARAAYDGPKACLACGYDLHVDICHLRPVADFSLDATLDDVNALDNLVALDKRCHWELDHGLLLMVEGRLIRVTPDAG